MNMILVHVVGNLDGVYTSTRLLSTYSSPFFDIAHPPKDPPYTVKKVKWRALKNKPHHHGARSATSTYRSSTCLKKESRDFLHQAFYGLPPSPLRPSFRQPQGCLVIVFVAPEITSRRPSLGVWGFNPRAALGERTYPMPGS